MQKRDLPYLVLGLLVTTVSACRTVANDNGLTTLEPEFVSAPTETTDVQGAPLPTPIAQKENTAEPPALPSPEPTVNDWLTIGDPRNGPSIDVPRGWVDLTDQIALPAIGNRLGINLLFAADSERTGRSLLAGKPISEGAYVTALLSAAPPSGGDLGTDALTWLAGIEPGVVPLAPPTPLTSDDGVPGVAIDVSGAAVGLALPDQGELLTRIVVYAPESQPGVNPSWIVFLLSAPSDQWPSYADRFNDALGRVRIGDVRPGTQAGSGGVAVRGALETDRDLVTATLEEGVSDVWTFDSAANRYASLFLRPEENDLDLTMTLLGPDRQTIAQVDNAFAGGSEVVTDLLLPQSGTFVVEVEDFFKESGRYTLSLVLSDIPAYSGGGPIEFGQAIQGDLPPNGRQYWIFDGSAGQRISVIVEPGVDTLDAILEIYGPDGRPLVTLDEGFSGDPEVASGVQLPASGEYAILVRSFSDKGGPYTLTLDETGEEVANFYDAGDLAYGESKTESLRRQEAHAWFFDGKAGDQVLIRANPLSAPLDLDIWLLNPRVERLATSDAGAQGEAESIETTLPEDGQYIILVRDFNGEAGDYAIALSANPLATPETAGSISYGDSVMGTIKPGASVAWTFNAQSGDAINITAQPSESSSDLLLILRGPGAAPIQIDNSPAGQLEKISAFVVPTAGTWEIILQEFFGESAGYLLSLERAQ